MRNKKGGFTLIEILLVIAIMALLAAAVIVAINPARQFADARNALRRSNVLSILNAVHQYATENNGILPAAITTTRTEVCKTGVSCTGLIDLSALTNNEIYLVEMPIDPLCPSGCGTNGTGYSIIKNTNGRVSVFASNTELGITEISFKR